MIFIKYVQIKKYVLNNKFCNFYNIKNMHGFTLYASFFNYTVSRSCFNYQKEIIIHTIKQQKFIFIIGCTL